MRKLMCVLIAALLLASGCTPKQDEPATTTGLKDGVYQAIAEGYGGKLTVEVTIADGSMTDLKLVDENESSPVINRALPIIKERILEAQSPIVDNVTGATFSSFVIKTAVADIAKQAGNDFGAITMSTAPAAKEAITLEAISTDLVIVGGGPAGLASMLNMDATALQTTVEEFNAFATGETADAFRKKEAKKRIHFRRGRQQNL